MVDLGQPWRLPYQFFLTPGTTAVMYEVGWCVFLYLMVLALEFLPAALEWLGLTKVRRFMSAISIGDHRPRRHALDAPPVVARRLLPHGARQAPPALVLAVPPDLLLRLVDRRGHRHGDLREHGLAPRVPGPARPRGARRPGRAARSGSPRAARSSSSPTSSSGCRASSASGRWRPPPDRLGRLVSRSRCSASSSCRRSSSPSRRDARTRSWRAPPAIITVLGVVLNRFNVSLIAFNWNVPDRYVPSARRDRHLDHDRDARRPDVPLDRQPHAGAPRASRLARRH